MTRRSFSKLLSALPLAMFAPRIAKMMPTKPSPKSPKIKWYDVNYSIAVCSDGLWGVVSQIRECRDDGTFGPWQKFGETRMEISDWSQAAVSA